MSIMGPSLLGIAGPTLDDWRKQYYEDDRWSLPPGIIDQPNPQTAKTSSDTPAKVPYLDVKKPHPFSTAFTSDYDDVDIG